MKRCNTSGCKREADDERYCEECGEVRNWEKEAEWREGQNYLYGKDGKHGEDA